MYNTVNTAVRHDAIQLGLAHNIRWLVSKFSCDILACLNFNTFEYDNFE